jgi:hypothetical protein
MCKLQAIPGSLGHVGSAGLWPAECSSLVPQQPVMLFPLPVEGGGYVLCCAVLCCAVLCCAVLCCAGGILGGKVIGVLHELE